MILKNSYSYKRLNLNLSPIFKAELASSREHEIEKSWLQLQDPKIIYLDKIKINSSMPSISSSNNLTDVGVEDLGLIINRADKKSKNYNKLTDPLEYKKNKNKSKKKIRTKIHINDDDDNISANSNQANFSKFNQSLALSLMRPMNPSKKPSGSQRISNIKVRKNTNGSKNNKTKEILQLDSAPPAKIILTDPMSIENLSGALSIPSAEIIKSLFMKGISVTVNQVVDIKLAHSIANDYGIIVEDTNGKKILTKQDQVISIPEKQSFPSRAPIVAVFGHVDHGKTTLLDTIRSTKAVSVEAGGITQRIAAYEVDINENKVIFLDTPGHAAFESTRLLGIQVADIGILVVAADDGLQPQSIEAINYLQESKIPFVVAINKIDKTESDIEKSKDSLSKFNINSQDLGGDKHIVGISALKNSNINLLLDAVADIANEHTFTANPFTSASGTVLDAYLDKKKGPVAHVLVQNGTLNIGDYIVNSNSICKIRNITQQNLKEIKNIGPSSVVVISGFSSIPQSGTMFKVLDNHPKQVKKQLAELQKTKFIEKKQSYQKLNTRITLETSSRIDTVEQKKVNIVLKTDSDGTIEAIIHAFSNIPQDKVQLNIVSVGVGEVNASDINLASVSRSLLLSFNNPTSPRIITLASKVNTTIGDFKVIYDLIEYVEQSMLTFVDIEYDEQIIGSAVVESVFAVSKGNVAGSIVTDGKLKRNAYIRVHRNEELMHEGKLSSLKRIKEDVEEIALGNECGVLCNNFDAWQKKDIISAYELIEKVKTL